MVEYAGFWIRLASGLIDVVIMWVISFLGGLLAGIAGSMAISYVVSALLIIAWIYLEGTLGKTPGKMALKLKVVNDSNEVIGIGRAILRYIGRIVCGITLGIGYLVIAWTEKKQGLHDKIASTYVIRE